MEQQQTEIRVLRVAEGQPGRDTDGKPSRIFSVVLSRPAGEDLGIVATAVDPGAIDSGQLIVDSERHCPLSTVHCPLPLAIPAPGSPHPTLAGFVARAPLIFSVGLRSKDGAMLAACSNFYNVRVRYERTVDSVSAAGGTVDNAANRPLSTVNCQLPTATNGSQP